MPLSEADKYKLRLALERVAPQLRGKGQRQQRRLLATMFEEAGVNPTWDEWEEFARGETAAMRLQEMSMGRTIRAMDAIMAEVKKEGVSTPAELMAKRGIGSGVELLASLGFTGDLNGLMREIERSIAEMQRQ